MRVHTFKKCRHAPAPPLCVRLPLGGVADRQRQILLCVSNVSGSFFD